ncbi:hypothetical protein KSP40_PGU013895 [Platanthera guangdongensis]|uniref:BRO1 domain-containing protein n=1 Tax=Platanthera guangdongensis TaxID=2320717 RepID=A0ABR2MTA3_9ASPA
MRACFHVSLTPDPVILSSNSCALPAATAFLASPCSSQLPTFVFSVPNRRLNLPVPSCKAARLPTAATPPQPSPLLLQQMLGCNGRLLYMQPRFALRSGTDQAISSGDESSAYINYRNSSSGDPVHAVQPLSASRILFSTPEKHFQQQPVFPTPWLNGSQHSQVLARKLTLTRRLQTSPGTPLCSTVIRRFPPRPLSIESGYSRASVDTLVDNVCSLINFFPTCPLNWLEVLRYDIALCACLKVSVEEKSKHKYLQRPYASYLIGLASDRASTTGVKIACNSFQAVVGSYTFLEGNVSVKDAHKLGGFMVDLSTECAGMLEKLMFAQTQECFFSRRL